MQAKIERSLRHSIAVYLPHTSSAPQMSLNLLCIVVSHWNGYVGICTWWKLYLKFTATINWLKYERLKHTVIHKKTETFKYCFRTIAVAKNFPNDYYFCPFMCRQHREVTSLIHSSEELTFVKIGAHNEFELTVFFFSIRIQIFWWTNTSEIRTSIVQPYRICMETSAFECAAWNRNARPTTLFCLPTCLHIRMQYTTQYSAAVASRSCSLGAGWLAYCANKGIRGKDRCEIGTVNLINRT